MACTDVGRLDFGWVLASCVCVCVCVCLSLSLSLFFVLLHKQIEQESIAPRVSLAGVGLLRCH